jgi:peptidoglycan-N-acetylglucosamine deacetylase
MKNKKVLYILVILFTVSITFNLISNEVITLAYNDSESDEVLHEDKELDVDDQNTVERRLVYLTFDDGPSFNVTNKLLDALKRENVKATFFVVGKEIQGKEAMLKRMHEEGHTIGIHTYTHNFKLIYKSEEYFIDEMRKTAALVKEIIGIAPTAIRFPGGSDKILNQEFLNKLHANGFKVYDWNVNLGDGLDAHLTEGKLLQNAKKVKGNPNVRIILAHNNSNNKRTYMALPVIVKYYREQGFEFSRINESTPEYYYRFRK